MPKQLTKGKAQLATQVREDVLARFKKYAESRGEKLTVALERAMEREMAYPPPDHAPEPLGDVADGAGKPAPAAKRGANSQTKRKT
jgi:hypothetical protein